MSKSKSVLNSFSSLPKNSKKFQIKCSLNILNHFLTKQKECGEQDSCEELKLGIERIVRGLGAHRANSRKGFFLTFVGLFELFSTPTITVQMCLDAIEKTLTEYESKTEKNDIHKGQILAYGGLIYSKKIFEASKKEIQIIVRRIISIGKKKSYLLLASHLFLIEYVMKVDEKVFKKVVWDIIRDEIILANKDTKSLYWYNLLFVLSKQFPLVVDEEFLISVTGCPSVLHKNSLEEFGKSLLVTSRNVSYINSPIYQQLLIELTSNEKVLKKVWLIIDECLSSTSSGTIVHIFDLFICCIQIMNDKNGIRKMMSPNFIKHLEIRSDVVEVEQVRCNAINVFSKILSNKCVLNSKTQKELVNKLYFYPGSLNFICGPEIKFFQSLINDFSEETVKSVSVLFTDILAGRSMKTVSETASNETLQKPWKESEKKRACDVILRLLNHPKVSNCVDWKVEQMKVIIDVAFFSKNEPERLLETARRSFYSSLDIKFYKLADLSKFLHDSIIYLDNKLQVDKNISFEFSKGMRKTWKKMMKTVNYIMSESGRNTDNKKLADSVFHVMFLLLGLSIFQEADLAVQNLEELNLIYEKMHSELDKNLEMAKGDKEEPFWTDVVIELVLSLLSNNSRFYRNIISKVFVFLCPFLTTQNVHQILNVLNPNTKSVMVADADNLMEDDNENDASLSKEQDAIDDDSTLDESSAESDLEEEKSEADYNKLRASIMEALGDKDAVTDNESVTLDEMDEEEGRRLDKSLSKAFMEIKEQKLKAQTDAKRQLCDFRIRVLDLLTIWLKTSPELTLVFDAMVTGLLLIENTLQSGTDVELQSKLQSFFKTLTSLNYFTNNGRLEVNELIALMKKLMSKEEKTASVYINMSEQIVQCCTFILKISLRQLKGTKKMKGLVLDVYKEALNKFFNEKNSVVPVGLFHSALTLPWEGSLDLIKDVQTYMLNQDIRPFHLQHALKLLLTFSKNKRLLNEDTCKKNINEIRQIALNFVDSVSILESKSRQLYYQFIEVCSSLKTLSCVSDIMSAIDIQSLRVKSSGKRKREAETTEKVKNKKRAVTKRLVREKKKSKLTRSEESSKGIEEGLFGSHLYNNSAFIQGKM